MARNRLSYVRRTIPQAAAYLGVSVNEARELVERGPIDGIRVGGRRTVVEQGALDRYLAGEGA